GNWIGGDDTEREAAWAEYYKEYGQPGEEGAAPASEAPTAQPSPDAVVAAEAD
ncbi:MAG: hypothetical protein JHC78_09385, partial [Ilumatobacteraceae bacterium]|nr:hypothetical protein [Ilumatobacteraceae bacterium]